MKKISGAYIFFGFFLTVTHATTFLYNWQSMGSGGLYNGYIEEQGTFSGNTFVPAEISLFSFGSLTTTYSQANSFLIDSDVGLGFEQQNGIITPVRPVRILTAQLGGSLLLEIQGTQEAISGQAGAITGTWTATNLDATVPDTTNSSLLLLTGFGALGVYHALSRRALTRA